MPFVHSVRLPSERRPLSNPADCACPAWEFALTSSSSLDAMDKTTTVHSPAITDEWRRQVVEHFKAMRAYVRGENVDDKIAEQEDDAFPEDFPDMEGELDYGDVDDSAIGPVHDAYSDVNKELGSCSESLLEELVDDVVATSEDNVDVPVKENSVTTTTVQSPMPTLPSLRNRSACFRTFYDPAANAASFDPSSLVSSMKQVWSVGT